MSGLKDYRYWIKPLIQIPCRGKIIITMMVSTIKDGATKNTKPHNMICMSRRNANREI